jgi:hypothetical protein
MFQVNTKFTESLRDAIDIAYEQEPAPSNFFCRHQDEFEIS